VPEKLIAEIMTDYPPNKWIELMVAHGQSEAQVIKGLLESSEITVRLTSTITQAAFPFTLNGLAEIKILVPESEQELARSILADYKDVV
jgi:hypothetical protein